MPRYIDRDIALSHPFANGQYDKENANEHFIFGFEGYKEWLEQLPTVDIDAINESHEKIGYDKGFRDGYAQATVDAVEVVRCKDCRWFENDGFHTNCKIMQFCVEAEDYCSRGERRENGTFITYYANDKPVETIVIDERKEYAKTD